MAERFHYRGYDIMPKRQWSSWCVGIYPTRADLPLLSRSTLDILSLQVQDAVDEAKRAIDRALENLPAKVACRLAWAFAGAVLAYPSLPPLATLSWQGLHIRSFSVALSLHAPGL